MWEKNLGNFSEIRSHSLFKETLLVVRKKDGKSVKLRRCEFHLNIVSHIFRINFQIFQMANKESL